MSQEHRHKKRVVQSVKSPELGLHLTFFAKKRMQSSSASARLKAPSLEDNLLSEYLCACRFQGAL
jgi:hypothetical protein